MRYIAEIREYERTDTTVFKCHIKAIMSKYMENLRKCLREMGIDAPLYILKDNGGITSADSILENLLRHLSPVLPAGSWGPVFWGANALAKFDYFRYGGNNYRYQCYPKLSALCSTEKILFLTSLLEVPCWMSKPLVREGVPLPGMIKVGDYESDQTAPGSAGSCLLQIRWAGEQQLQMLNIPWRLNPFNFLYGDIPLDVQAASQALEKLGAIRKQKMKQWLTRYIKYP